MLALARRRGETIDINGGARAGGLSFTILEIRGQRVRIAFEDGGSHQINRREVQESKDREAAQAVPQPATTP